jgi:hypothetical protein
MYEEDCRGEVVVLSVYVCTVCIREHTPVCMYKHKYVPVCGYVCMCVCVYVRMCVCARVHMCVCVYTCETRFFSHFTTEFTLKSNGVPF